MEEYLYHHPNVRRQKKSYPQYQIPSWVERHHKREPQVCSDQLYRKQETLLGELEGKNEDESLQFSTHGTSKKWSKKK